MPEQTYEGPACAEILALEHGGRMSNFDDADELGRKLLRMDEYFSPNANFLGIVRLTTNAGSSDYHSLQLRFQRRLSHGLQTLVSYTWAHSLDNASQDGTVVVTPSTFSNPSTDRGDSDWDLRHNLAASISYDIPTPRANPSVPTFFRQV